MYSEKVKSILDNSGYDFDYPITAEHVLSLMQQCYELGAIGNMKKISCSYCFGSGYIIEKSGKQEVCHQCNGNGSILVTKKS